MEFEKATLLNLAEGAAPEKFQFELERVIENIKDLNTDPKAKRKVILEVTFSPDAERRTVAVEISAKSKLIAEVPASTMIHLVKDGAVVPPMHQMDFEDLNAEQDDTIDLNEKRNGEQK